MNVGMNDYANATLADSFMDLFRGRTDVYGSETGGCVKEEITNNLVLEHFNGHTMFGVYPLEFIAGEWKVAWGCSDIDINDYNIAHDLKDAFDAAGVIAHIEQSRSKGYHVWVFADDYVPATDMRNMFLAAHQVADIPPREVNPKQETLAPGQYGNYVRLPYGNWINNPDDTHRKILVDKETPMDIRSFIQLANACRTSAETIKRLAGFYKPPTVKTMPPIKYEDFSYIGDALKLLSPLAKVIWRDGPLPGKDRSTTLVRLGHECVSCGLSPSETRCVLVDADLRWGKYHLRINGELEIDKIVQRVFLTH